MSADHPGSSFGDSTAQPPTPQRTPVSAALPSPVFETPKPNTGRLDESTGWTPRFAEEYSVFNATPGNLRGCQTSYPDFGPPTPFSGDTDERRSSTADGIGLGVGVNVNELSPAPSLSLPSVEPSKILRSSPNPLRTPTADRTGPAPANPATADSAERTAKKPRRGTIIAPESQGQTATPPPSSHKGERKLAPKPATMQNDQDFISQAHFVSPSPQQQSMGSFVASQNDMFGYPLSAPAATPYGTRSFWDADPSLASMDIDFGAGSAGVFPTPTLHQVAGAVDWTTAAQLLPSPGGLASNGNAHSAAGTGATTLVSQAPLSMLAASSADTSMLAASFAAPMDTSFGITDANGGVNPGLLFSRPQTAVDSGSVTFSQGMPALSPTAPAAAGQDHPMADQGAPIPKPPAKVELRRSASAKDPAPRKQERQLANSPVKDNGRPGLTRSFSENRGKKATTLGRPNLPPLAPRPRSQLVSNAGVNANKPIISQPQRPSSGRSSPPKSSHGQHHPNHTRLGSLSSIPELQHGPEMRTQATFMIDANGRARVETTVVVVDSESRNGAAKRVSSYSVAPPRKAGGWDSDDDDSSTDDEPIIIPSRTSSFALPDPRKPTGVHPFQSQRRTSERSTTSSSYASFQGKSRERGHESDSDEEGVANRDDGSITPTRRASGDALSELRKLRETRQKQQAAAAAAAAAGSRQQKRYHVPIQYPRHQPTSSPTTLSESSLPTPTDRSSRNIKCVCHRAEAGREELLVQCQSCEMYVHGSCVSITERTMPSIYICAFCANMPTANGTLRPRESGSISSSSTAVPLGSPLMKKSVKSFR
ncbi:hypothetical protein VTJ04DRAFT_586 [Mycothermus thermophilus]|uniref:uncharacterized protein n=1 Tax=Humicola insolens TaxID=85995 RepID=UPI00374305A8